MWLYIYADLPRYTPTENTLFYLKNDWDIIDYSDYGHTVNWAWTADYTTLNTWIKVVHTTSSSWVYSNYFTESIGKTTFTMHIWFKWISSPSSEYTMWWWMGRAGSTTTTDRWWAKRQASANSANLYVVYWANNTNWQLNQNYYITYSTSAFQLYTVTVSWSTVTLYKNGSQVASWSWSYPMVGWSNTGTCLYLWIGWYRDWSAISNGTPWYFWETILEDRVWTQTEIAAYYNLIKGNYWLS